MKFTLLAVAGLILAAAPALAETQIDNIVAEQRITLGIRAKPDAVQTLLPKGWIPSARPTGANLTIIFIDRALTLTPEGKVFNAGANRMLTLVVEARNQRTGETRQMIVGGYSADPLSVPGAYKVNRAGEVDVTRRETKTSRNGKLEGLVEEHWTAKGQDGGKVSFDIAYTVGPLAASKYEERNYSGADPDFSLIQRAYVAGEPLRNATVDRVKSIRLKASGGQVGAAVDGSEQIVGIASSPFYSRLTFLP